MTIRNIRKNLAGMEDLLQGVGTEEQVRGTSSYTMGKVDVPYAVTNIGDMQLLDVDLFTRARVYSSTTEFVDYIYDSARVDGVAPVVGAGSWIVSSGAIANVTELRLRGPESGAYLTTVDYGEQGKGGGSAYLVLTLAEARTLKGDPTWVPDTYGDQLLANGNVAILQVDGVVDVQQYGGINTDAATVQIAIDAINAAGKIPKLPAGAYDFTAALVVDDFTLMFDGPETVITINGDHDGIVLKGTTRPQLLRCPTFLFDKSQTAGKAGIRLGDGVTVEQCAHFVVDTPTFEVVGGSGRTEADGIVFADNGTTGFAYIGQINAPKFRNLNRGIYGVYAVNAIEINEASTHRCKNPWKLGDCRSVLITNPEFGGNFARCIDFGDCFGVTLDTPYFEDNCANNGGHTLPTIKADIYVSGRTSEGFRRDNPGSGLTILNPTFGKLAATCETDYPIYVENGKNVKVHGGHTVATSGTNYANGLTWTNNSNNIGGEIIDFVNDATGSGTTPAPSIGASAQVKVGTHASVSLIGSAAYDIPSLAAGASDSFTITVTGAVRGDFCLVSSSASIAAGLDVSSIIGGTDTVRVTVTNTTAGAIDPGNSTWRAIVFQKDGYFA